MSSGGYLGRVAQQSDEDSRRGSAAAAQHRAVDRCGAVRRDAAAVVRRPRARCGRAFASIASASASSGRSIRASTRTSTLSPTATLRASLGRFHQPPSPAHFDEFADNLNAKSSYVDQATLARRGRRREPALVASVTGFFHEGRKTLVDIAGEQHPADAASTSISSSASSSRSSSASTRYQDNVGRAAQLRHRDVGALRHATLPRARELRRGRARSADTIRRSATAGCRTGSTSRCA